MNELEHYEQGVGKRVLKMIGEMLECDEITALHQLISGQVKLFCQKSDANMVISNSVRNAIDECGILPKT